MSNHGDQPNNFDPQPKTKVDKYWNFEKPQQVSIYSRAAEEFFRLDMELQILLSLPYEVSVSQTVNTTLSESIRMLDLSN
jgi:hypothetical protein